MTRRRRSRAIDLLAAAIVAAWLAGVALLGRIAWREPAADPFLDQYLDGMTQPASRTYRAWSRPS